MSDSPDEVLRVFLSHRYKASAVNRQLFSLLAETFAIQFTVDEGISQTSTTRLERLIREADALIGFHTLPSDASAAASGDEIRRESRYFRLEVGIADRARRPAFLLADNRLSATTNQGDALPGFRFDADEILHGLTTLHRRTVAQRAADFRDRVLAGPPGRDPTDSDSAERTVGLFLPDTIRRDKATRDAVEGALDAVGRTARWMDWPPRFTQQGLYAANLCDWLVVESSMPAGQAAAAFLYGRGAPVLRTYNRSSEPAEGEPAQTLALFGDIDQIYNKSTIYWSTPDEFGNVAGPEFALIARPSKLISSRERAESYFRSAALRKNPVFLSYANEDRQYAAEISSALREHFRDVYDYKNGSNPLGADWYEHMTRNLADATIGIPLISSKWTNSGYCRHEGNSMMKRYLDGAARVFPVLLDGAYSDIFGSLQYTRKNDTTPTGLVAEILRQIDQPRLT